MWRKNKISNNVNSKRHFFGILGSAFAANTVLREAYIWEARKKLEINYLTGSFKKMEKKNRRNKFQSKHKEGVIMIRKEVNKIELKKTTEGEESRWRRNRTGRPLSLLQIHRKNN